MVFVVKYRKYIISEEVFELMKKIFSEIEARYYLSFDAIGHEQNHLHLLVRAPPRLSPSRIMQICKSISAIQIFKKFPKLKEDVFWGCEFWSDGGHVDTVSDGRSLERVKDYVLSQGRDISKLNVNVFVP